MRNHVTPVGSANDCTQDLFSLGVTNGISISTSRSFSFLRFLISKVPGSLEMSNSVRSNMAATTEQNTKSLEQEDETISGGEAIAKDSTEVSSEPVLEEPSGLDKPEASGAEVLSLKDCCREAFDKITEYLNGELAGSIQDYVLLEKLNKLTVTKYSEMSDTAKTLITVMEELDKKYKSLEPYLEQIDKVEESVASLEQAAYRLDAYSKRLEAKFKKLERR